MASAIRCVSSRFFTALPRLFDASMQFAGETLFHRVFVARARGADQPADRQRLTALGTNFDRHLIGGAADAARAHFDRRRDIAERIVERFDRRALQLLLDRLERAIDDLLGDGLLALVHDVVHELGERRDRHKRDRAELGAVSAR